MMDNTTYSLKFITQNVYEPLLVYGFDKNSAFFKEITVWPENLNLWTATALCPAQVNNIIG